MFNNLSYDTTAYPYEDTDQYRLTKFFMKSHQRLLDEPDCNPDE
ncbi:hypothetical protein ACTFAO_21135 [Sphingobacterium spiritivorum]